MHGVKRIVIFCSLTTVLPTILLVLPLYLRHSLYASVVYTVAESDIMEIDDGISTIFCSEHSLEMSTPFHAFKMPQRPEMSKSRKHIQLRKSMTLPDDTLEYWGFYLLKGATVALSVCSRFQGASILVVKGERSLRTCGMMDHNINKKGINKGDNLFTKSNQVRVTVESKARETESRISDKKLKVYNGDSFVEEPDEDEESSNNEKELPNSGERELEILRKAAMVHIKKHVANSRDNNSAIGGRGTDKVRHVRRRLGNLSVKKNNDREGDEEKSKQNNENNNNNRTLEKKLSKRETPMVDFERDERIKKLKDELDSEAVEEVEDEIYAEKRIRRNQNGVDPQVLLDRRVEHGGNAMNVTNSEEDSSISSFENGLLSCYEGQVLLAHQFEPSPYCTNISYLVNSKRIHTKHNVVENGYYYYIFYSDNDYFSNDMHAVFDIYKPTFQYENASEACINKTKCNFVIELLSDERVIVEVPTKDGLEDREEDIYLLTSTCRPRMGIYTIFPIAVLLLVLGCAFL